MGYNEMTKEEWREKEEREKKNINRCNSLTNATNLVVALVNSGADLKEPRAYQTALAEELEKWLNR